MSVAQRLRRLERDMGAAFTCPVCGGHGTLEMVIAEPDEPDPTGIGCRGCGRVNVLMILREAVPPAGWEAGPASR